VKKALMMLALLGCSKGETATTKPAASANLAESPPPTQEQLQLAQLKEATGLPEMSAALAIIKPQLRDSRNDVSVANVAFQMWATMHMKWSDVAVEKNETSYALFQKDPDEERGKRVCLSGQIIQIAKEAGTNRKGFAGLISTGTGNLFNFFAVGSSGTLVSTSWAKICGVALEKFDYSNSGGGTGHAVSIVGMFDLPENRSAAPKAVDVNSLPQSR